jgi:hypothetical protein
MIEFAMQDVNNLELLLGGLMKTGKVDKIMDSDQLFISL